MTSLLSPTVRAVAQLDDPVFLGVVLRSLLLSACVFALLAAGAAWGAQHLVHDWLPRQGWLGWVAGAVSGLGAALTALWLFLPLAVVIGTLFLERVVAAVDRRFYPFLPPSRAASFAAQMWDGAELALRVLLLNVLALALAFALPGVGLAIGWVIAAWSFGRGLFVAVAMLRMGRVEAQALYERNRTVVLAQGAIFAFAGTVPLLNLLVPVLGTAAMVHVLHQSGR